MTIEKCEKTYKQHIHIHPEIAIEFTHARSRFKGSSDISVKEVIYPLLT